MRLGVCKQTCTGKPEDAYTRAKFGEEIGLREQGVPGVCCNTKEDKGGVPWVGMRLGGSWCSHSPFLF